MPPILIAAILASIALTGALTWIFYRAQRAAMPEPQSRDER